MSYRPYQQGTFGSGGPVQWLGRNVGHMVRQYLGKRKRSIGAASVASLLGTALKRRSTLVGRSATFPIRRRPTKFSRAYAKFARSKPRGRRYGTRPRKRVQGRYWPSLRHGRNLKPVNYVVRKFLVETTINPDDVDIENGHGWQLEFDGHNPELPFQKEFLQAAGEGKKPLGMTDWAQGYTKMRVLACKVTLFVEDVLTGSHRTGGTLCSRTVSGEAPVGGTDVGTYPPQSVRYGALKSLSVVDGFLQSVRDNGEWKTFQIPAQMNATIKPPIVRMSQYMTPYKVIGSDYDPHQAVVVPTKTALTADNPGLTSGMHAEFKFIALNNANPDVGSDTHIHRIRVVKEYWVRYSDPLVTITA